MASPDELDDYLRGDSALSCQYRREAAPLPPHGLDRRVLEAARAVHDRSPCLAPLALAASVLLSVALVLAIVFGPQTAPRTADAPRLVRTAAHAEASARLYSSDPTLARDPRTWLADIAMLRRAGKSREAEAELRRFRSVYPNYPLGGADIRP